MNKHFVTRRHFLGTAAAVAATTFVPAPIFGRDKMRRVMPAPDTLRKVDAFWSAYFGCSPQHLNEARTLVVSHRALAGYDGVLVFRHAHSCIVSVPDSVPEIERSKLRTAQPTEASDPRLLGKAFAVSTDRVQGPAWLGIADRSVFTPVRSKARILGDADAPAIERLALGCDELAWTQSRLLRVQKPLFGLFEGGDLVAVSGHVVLGDVLAYIGVITHHAHRGRGYAKSVVSAAMNGALEKGFIPMWRTPVSNEAAITVARSLGFQPYATTIDVQITEDEF